MAISCAIKNDKSNMLCLNALLDRITGNNLEKTPESMLNSVFHVYFLKTPLVSYALFLFSHNKRIHSLSPVPQITRFLLVDAIISSKTNTDSGSKKQKRSNSKVKNNKTISGILSFI